jgi:plasmid stabilization system protein ParE
VARRLRWTEAAALDLEEAALFIARDSPFYAAALSRGLEPPYRKIS